MKIKLNEINSFKRELHVAVPWDDLKDNYNQTFNKYMSNYLELTQLSDGTIVLRRSDDHDNPIVKIEFSNESKDFLNGEELAVAKEMIRAGIESVSGNAIDFDDFFIS